VALRLLYTSDEHGWIAPSTEKGKARDGAAGLLARWLKNEGHCVPGTGQTCEGAATLALSGGDNWTGPALSSFFQGEPAALAMQRLGYAASALGNHELDFGRLSFEKNAAQEGFPYVGANVAPTLDQGGITRPFVLLRRQGVAVGVVGLSTSTTPRVGMRENYKGLSFGDEEKALEQAIPAAYEAGADVVVVVAHVCADVLRPIVARHADWKLAFVGAGHCHRLVRDRVFTTPLIEPGSFLRSYIRVDLSVDRSRPPRERVIGSSVEVVDLTYDEGKAGPIEPHDEMAHLVAGWQQRTDQALGEVIGYTEENLDPDSAPLVNFITDRWREATGADVAILNRFGTRQAIQKGPISLQTIYSVMPFVNRLVTVRVTGEQLIRDVTCCHGHVSGIKRLPDGGFALVSGARVEPAGRYVIAATDYTYFGGSEFPFEKQDPSPVVGDDWRDPLIRWMRAHPTSPGKSLDRLIDHEARFGHKP
jgi:2',3'-cyclic-nucleotide 2'-phosphodiesterase (5'-nucleotidase family)